MTDAPPRRIPVYSESLTHWGVPGIVRLLRFGPIADNGRSPGWSPDVGFDFDALVDFWCGVEDEHCQRFARMAALLPPGDRWADASGWLGSPKPEWTPEQVRVFIDAQTESLLHYGSSLADLGIDLDGIYCDNDYGRQAAEAKARRIEAMLYASGAFRRERTRCIDRCVWYGYGQCKDEDGLMNRITPIDGRTVMVNWYLRNDIGVDLDVQAARNIEAAIGARRAGYDILPLVRGAKYGRTTAVPEAPEYDQKTRAAYMAQARHARRDDSGVIGVIYFPEAGIGQYPLKDPGVDYTIQHPAGTWNNDFKCHVPTAQDDAIATAEAWMGTNTAAPIAAIRGTA